MDVDDDAAGRARSLLSADEVERAGRFRDRKGRRRYVVARARLRQLLGALTGVAPGALRFSYGPRGKPSLAGGPAFNLSHSRGFVFVAVRRAGRIGADIEVLRPVRRVGNLAERYFAPDEAAAVLAAPRASQLDAFFRIWTRKEAVLKGLGGGFAVPPRSFSVLPSPTEAADDVPACRVRVREAGSGVTDWYVDSAEVAKGVVAAVASDRPFAAAVPLPRSLAPREFP